MGPSEISVPVLSRITDPLRGADVVLLGLLRRLGGIPVAAAFPVRT
jgi:hypothetical protein